VQRALSLAKYLPQFGFEVHVLSAGNAAAPVQDPRLLKHVPPSVTVHHSFTPELPFALQQKLWGLISPPRKAAEESSAPTSRKSWKSSVGSAIKNLLCPDPQVVWVPFATRKARQIIRRHDIEAVLVTVPPFSTLLASNALKREFPRLKLITDNLQHRLYEGNLLVQRLAVKGRDQAARCLPTDSGLPLRAEYPPLVGEGRCLFISGECCVLSSCRYSQITFGRRRRVCFA
jgi:hypothetical protein